MAQINLLKHTTTPQQQLRNVSGIAVKILAVIVLGLLGYYGYMWSQLSGAKKQELVLQAQIQKAQEETKSFQGVEELSLRQQQLKEFATLFDKHIYWSTFFPALAKASFHDAIYTSVQVDTDGVVTMNVRVPDMSAVDKLLQVFNEPEVNKNFKNIRLGSLDMKYGEEQSGISTEIRFEFTPELLKYNKQYDPLK